MDPLVVAQLIVSGVLLGGVYALFAAGLNLIFGVMRVINIAHGELMMLGAYTTFWLFTLWGVNPILSLLISVPLLFLLGAVLERIFIERIVGQPLLISLLLTFGFSLFFSGSALTLWSNDFRSVPYFSGSLVLGPLALPISRTVAFALAVVITLAVWFFLQRTRLGKAVRATAQSAEVALVCGIDVRRIRLLTFALGSSLAGAAGTLVSVMFSFSPAIGATFLAKGFAIIVLGGLGSFLGALAGGVLLGMTEVFGSYFTTASLAEAIPYLVLLLMLLVRPTGFFGTAE
ncbi:MAG: branched-chain amino acid ABC transporter permease [Chloroflexi bacterium]|nr:branched-chain amino acid ABC transporter permease [Chloroflexota bacterium]